MAKIKTFKNPSEVDIDLMRQDRIKSGLDQETTATAMGIAPSTLSTWECQKRCPKVYHVIKFGEVIGENPQKYVTGDALRQVTLMIGGINIAKDFARQL